MLQLCKKTHLFQILLLMSRWFEESDVKFCRLCSTLNETLTYYCLIIPLEQIALAQEFRWTMADEVALWDAEELLWANNWPGCLQWFWLRKISVCWGRLGFLGSVWGRLEFVLVWLGFLGSLWERLGFMLVWEVGLMQVTCTSWIYYLLHKTNK